MENIIYELKDIWEISECIINEAKSNFVTFEGNLGSGKTTLIRHILMKLGCQDLVSSPTFGIVNTHYNMKGDAIAHHFDLYRLQSDIELYDLGFEEYLNSQCWIFLEWPQIMYNQLPESRTEIYLNSVSSETRQITLKNFPIR